MEGAPAVARAFGRTLRALGQSLDRYGLSLSPHLRRETLVPSTRVVNWKGAELKSGKTGFVASSATVVGDVTLGEQASVWYGAVVRGEKKCVSLGVRSAVMDNAYVSGSSLGEDAIVSPGAFVDGAAVGAGAVVGARARVLPGASVGAGAYVDAGGVVGSCVAVPPGALWAGGRVVRTLSASELAFLRATAGVTAGNAAEHEAQGALPPADVEEQADIRVQKMEGGFNPDTPIKQGDPDIAMYYKLSGDLAPQGYLRVGEADESAERAAREAEEAASDAAEEERYTALARAARLGEAVAALANIRIDKAEARGEVVAELGRRDPAAVPQLLALMGRAAEASADAHAKVEVEAVVRQLLAAGGAGGAPLRPAAVDAALADAVKALAAPLETRLK